MAKISITKHENGIFSISTDTILADGSIRRDNHCELRGNILRSKEERGIIRVGGLIRISLGPISLHRVSELGLGETAVL